MVSTSADQHHHHRKKPSLPNIPEEAPKRRVQRICKDFFSTTIDFYQFLLYICSIKKNQTMKNTTIARNSEFISICLEIIRRDTASGIRPSITAVLTEAIHRQPHCHYASYEHTSRMLHLIERKGIDSIPRKLQRLKWQEISNQVKEAMDGPRKLPFDKALTFVLGFRRPSRFYFDTAHALRIIRPHIHFRLYAN